MREEWRREREEQRKEMDEMRARRKDKEEMKKEMEEMEQRLLREIGARRMNEGKGIGEGEMGGNVEGWGERRDGGGRLKS